MDTLNIQSPEEFYGFKMGSDQKLARWDKIVEYFNLLGKSSNRIRVTELGKSTMGNPFILVVIFVSLFSIFVLLFEAYNQYKGLRIT